MMYQLLKINNNNLDGLYFLCVYNLKYFFDENILNHNYVHSIISMRTPSSDK